MSLTYYRTFPQRFGQRRSVNNRILGLGSQIFSCGPQFSAGASAQIGAGAWPTANKAIAMSFRISQSLTVIQLGWWNGSGTMTDSVDIGIFTSEFARLVSGGGTARSGSSSIQFVDVAETVLGPGSYYLAMSNNGTTSNNTEYLDAGLSVSWVGAMGGLDSADDLYPLPDPLTNMTTPSVFTRMPPMFIATRTPW